MAAIDATRLTEEDVKLRRITPAILGAGWDARQVRMEAKITAGKVSLRGNFAHRAAPKKADYLLHLAPNRPIAVVEAKDDRHTASHGLLQAMTYAWMLDLPLAVR